MAHEDYNMLGGTVGGGYLSATDPNENGMYEDDSNYLYEQIQPQYVSNRGGVLAPMAYGAAALMATNRETPSTTGMEFIDYIGRNADPQPDYSPRIPLSAAGSADDNSWMQMRPSAPPQGPLMMSPGPSRRNDAHERFMQSGPAIREHYRRQGESQNGGPRRGAVPRVDSRTDWQKWKDSFKDGFAAK